MAKQIWDLDAKGSQIEAHKYMHTNGFDKGTSPKFSVGSVIEFYTEHNDDIRARATIKGISGNDIYVYNAAYWFPIQDDEKRKIAIAA